MTGGQWDGGMEDEAREVEEDGEPDCRPHTNAGYCQPLVPVVVVDGTATSGMTSGKTALRELRDTVVRRQVYWTRVMCCRPCTCLQQQGSDCGCGMLHAHIVQHAQYSKVADVSVQWAHARYKAMSVTTAELQHYLFGDWRATRTTQHAYCQRSLHSQDTST